MPNSRYALACLLCCLPLCLAFAPHDEPGAPDDALLAAAAGIGGSGPFQASNMEILAHLPLSEIGGGPANILANDCWGWTDSQTGKEYAICGLMQATSFVDISDPANPRYLGQLPSHTGISTWRDMKVYDDHVFIVADNNDDHGMQVFDLTQLRTVDPDNPVVFSNTAHYSGCASSHNIVINEDTGYAYIVGSNRADGGLHVVDIQNPVQPVEAGNFDNRGYCHDAQVVSYAGPDEDYFGREVAFCCNGRLGSDNDALVIVDVTTKSNMTLISANNYPEPGYAHQGWLSEDHRYFYLGDETDEANFGGPTRILVWDCLDLDAPQFMGFAAGPTNAVDHNLYIRDDKLYLANYSAGLRVLQIDALDPTNLTEIAFADTYVTDDDTDYDGAWSSYPYFDSGVIVVNDRQNGLFLVRLAQLEFEFPDGLPDLVDPDGDVEFTVQINPFEGLPAPGTATLHVNRGSGFEPFAMTSIGDDLYEAVFPPMECGSVIRYFVSAESTAGIVNCNPPTAPDTTYSAIVADALEFTFADNFETDQGWTVSGDAEEGQWERAIPSGDGDRGDPTSDADGSSRCFLTQDGAGNTDVDGGSTILTSPLMDAVGSGNAVSAFVTYSRWYSNDVGNAPASDIFTVQISNNDGETWTPLETVGPGGNEVSGGWIRKTFEINEFLTPTAEMRLRFTASDLGDGSVVEAGIDGMEIMLLQCEPDAVLLGDVNLDGVVNLLDVAPFVDVLSGGLFQAEADMNQDGVVNLLDVDAFVQTLGG